MADIPKMSKEALREIVSQIIWSYWPVWGAPLVSAVLAYASGYNLAVIWLFTLFSFAMIALALNSFSQWRTAQSAAGKVEFLLPSIGVVNFDGKDPVKLRGIKLGAVLRSTAIFPMEVRIDSLETQIGDRVPGEAFKVRSVTGTRGTAVQFNNGMINLADLERANKLVHGRISASATYGRPGRLKYSLDQVWYMAFKFDKDGNLEGAEPSHTAFAKEEVA